MQPDTGIQGQAQLINQLYADGASRSSCMLYSPTQWICKGRLVQLARAAATELTESLALTAWTQAAMPFMQLRQTGAQFAGSSPMVCTYTSSPQKPKSHSLNAHT